MKSDGDVATQAAEANTRWLKAEIGAADTATDCGALEMCSSRLIIPMKPASIHA
jgi:hypothetical protein